MNNHNPDCDVNDVNPDGIKKPCNCGSSSFTGPLCSAHIPDHTGYHFRKCKRPAKWMIAAGPRCGLHARQWKTSRTLIAPNEKGQQ